MTSKCILREHQLEMQMDQLDNPLSFHINLSYPKLLRLFTIGESKRNNVFFNQFFGRMVDPEDPDKTLYCRLKWLVFLHEALEKVSSESSLHGYTHKALNIYLLHLQSISSQWQPYQKYLKKVILKPFIQYLMKLCQLEMHEGYITAQEQQGKFHEQDINEWYKEYNFLLWTVQTFKKPIVQVEKFFADSFPYLNNLGQKICQDANNCIKNLRLKYTKNIQLKNYVSGFEIFRMINRVKEMKGQCSNSFEKGLQLDISDTDVTEFISSPVRLPVKRKSFMVLTSPKSLSN